MTATGRTEGVMRVDIYTLAACLVCARIIAYFQHKGAEIHNHNHDDIEGIKDRILKAQVRADSDYQDGRSPLVYIDGEYQELDDVLAKVKAWEIAQRNDCDRCSKDFIL